MTAIRTYKLYIAAILIALYSFIAFAELRHHHAPLGHYVVAGLTASTDQPEYAFAKGSVAKANVDCPLCALKYSAYKQDTTLSLELSVVVPIAWNGYYSLPVIASSSFSPPNKGPPYTA